MLIQLEEVKNKKDVGKITESKANGLIWPILIVILVLLGFVMVRVF